MRCKIKRDDPDFNDVVIVQVPSIYKNYSAYLPERMAKMVRSAAEALDKVYEEIVEAGGHLYLSDMFRSAEEQDKAHQDFITGRKTAFSPPACGSVHESGRAIDIDIGNTVIGHRRVRQILNKHGWTNIVDSLTADESWHYEFREEKYEEIRRRQGYTIMARTMKQDIGNVGALEMSIKREEEIRWVQNALNRIMGTSLIVDGIYGEKSKAAMRLFQEKFDLQVDGIAGPITKKKLGEEMSKLLT
jgi:hypothetical protein